MKQKLRTIWMHPWTVGVCNIALIFVLYSLMRLFYYLISLDLYPDVSLGHWMEMMIGGMRFDVTALFYLNSLYMVLMFAPHPWRSNKTYLTVAKWFYWVPNCIGVIANCMDMVYMRFTDRRTTMKIFSEFENEGNIGSIIWNSVWHYWYVTLFGMAVIAVWVLLTRTKAETEYPLYAKKPKWVYYIRETILFCISIYFVVIGIRSGFGSYTRPLTLSNALQYTDRPLETNIVLNTPFSLMRSSEGNVYVDPHYMTLDEAARYINPVRQPHNTLAEPTCQNVVVFILESFSKEYFGYFNGDLDEGTYKGYTPFLDSLLDHSVTFQRSFATGRKSIDAMPSVLSSLPRVGDPYILTPYSTNNVSSIAYCLRELGYETGFFHGAPNGSMGFQAYARSCGFKSYYGLTEYNEYIRAHENRDPTGDYDGYWAVWDEEFLQYYAKAMSDMKEPFMTSVFTASSHHPFRIPERYKSIYPEEKVPIHKCILYADNALRLFFETAKQQPWYKNTLFVLTADHTNELWHPEYTNDKGRYEVPIIFYDPQWEEHPERCPKPVGKGYRLDSVPVAQADIMPSVLEYVGYNKPYFSFGEDALTETKNRPYVVCSNPPVYQLFTDKMFIQSDGEKLLHVYDYSQDRCLKTDLVKDADTETEMMYLKAFIEQYIYRMIHNELVVDNGNKN